MRKQGFLLIELVVALGILAAILMAVAAFTSDIFTLKSYSTEALTESDELRRALKQFVAELRTAELGDNGAYPLVATTGTSISFYSDANSDGKRELIRYFVDGQTFKRGEIKPSGTPAVYTGAESITKLVNNLTVTSGIFSYYPATYAGTGSALVEPVIINNVRLVKVALTVDGDPNKLPGPVTDTTQVSIRNLKDNL